MVGAADTEGAATPIERALDLISMLADEVGPRRPTSAGERLARERLRVELVSEGVPAEIERFDGYSTFALPFGAIQLTGLMPSLLSARRRRLRSALALASGVALAAEGDLRWTPVSDLFSRWESGNVVATIEPAAEARRTVCLMAHLDTSRSGLIFDPRFVHLLGAWISATSIAGLAQALGEPLLGGSRGGRRALGGLRAVLAAGLALLAERELRGVDVPGANDNASGCAVASVLAMETAAEPLSSTRVVLVLTGCEESGTLGAQALMDRHDTREWLFLNVDNVAGDGRVRFLTKEGVLATWPADPELVAVAERVATEQPDLRLAAEDSPAGLTYDTSPVHAAGGRGLTFSVQEGSIPNLHWPTDTYANVDAAGVERTLDSVRAVLLAVDAGEADR